MKEVKSMSMCRIRLVENVRMHVVADKSLQELYEKLTDIPFVTEDNRRPMLTCFICYAKLKRCCQLQRQCLQAEELLARMLYENYKLYPVMYPNQLQGCGGFITTPIENINIVDDYQVENDAIKVEVLAVSETQCEIELIQLKKEPLSHESNKQHDSYQELGDNPLQHSESDSEDDLPLMVMKFEEEQEQLAKQTTSTSVAKRPELDKRKVKQEDVTPAQHENNGLSDSKIIQKNKNHAFEFVKIKDPMSIINPTVNKCIVEDSTETLNKQNIKQVTNHSTTAIDTNSRNNCNENDLMCNMWNHEGINDDDINKSQSLCIIRKRKENPYKCDICQKSFALKTYLNAHVLIHSAEKPYKCEICSKSFVKKAHLNAHVRTHTGEKPYKCVTCQKSFAKKNILNKHIPIHTGERPFECEICHKSFIRKYSLKEHVRIHTGEKPFKCEICLKSYSHKKYLKMHMRKHG